MKIKQISFTLLKAIDHSSYEYCEALIVIVMRNHAQQKYDLLDLVTCLTITWIISPYLSPLPGSNLA